MLVHYTVRKGILHTAGLRIYGAATGHPPPDGSFEFYRAYADCLEDATYREGTLSKIFGKPFPEIAFKYSTLAVLPDQTIIKICAALELPYKRWGKKQRLKEVRKAIQNGSSG